MRKQIVLSLFFAFVSLSLSAQQGYFGYISFNKTVQLMPEYMEAQLKLEQLRADYKNEVERSKREFDRQYTDFMINQDQLSSTIVAKRQKELQLLMDNNVEFRQNVINLIDDKVNNFGQYAGLKFGSMEGSNNEAGNWED